MFLALHVADANVLAGSKTVSSPVTGAFIQGESGLVSAELAQGGTGKVAGVAVCEFETMKVQTTTATFSKGIQEPKAWVIQQREQQGSATFEPW